MELVSAKLKLEINQVFIYIYIVNLIDILNNFLFLKIMAILENWEEFIINQQIKLKT